LILYCDSQYCEKKYLYVDILLHPYFTHTNSLYIDFCLVLFLHGMLLPVMQRIECTHFFTLCTLDLTMFMLCVHYVIPASPAVA